MDARPPSDAPSTGRGGSAVLPVLLRAGALLALVVGWTAAHSAGLLPGGPGAVGPGLWILLAPAFLSGAWAAGDGLRAARRHRSPGTRVPGWLAATGTAGLLVAVLAVVDGARAGGTADPDFLIGDSLAAGFLVALVSAVPAVAALTLARGTARSRGARAT